MLCTHTTPAMLAMPLPNAAACCCLCESATSKQKSFPRLKLGESALEASRPIRSTLNKEREARERASNRKKNHSGVEWGCEEKRGESKGRN